MPLVSASSDGGVLALSWSVAYPLEVVWGAVVDADVTSLWLGRPVEGCLRPGETLVVDHGDGYLCRSQVVEVDEPRHLAMTWQFPDEPASRVALDVESSGSGALVRLTHRDLGDVLASYVPGWMTHLTYLEAAISGAPIPHSFFWELHGTLAVLSRKVIEA